MVAGRGVRCRIRKAAHTHDPPIPTPRPPLPRTVSVLFLGNCLVIWKIWWDEGSLLLARGKALATLGGLQARINLQLVQCVGSQWAWLDLRRANGTLNLFGFPGKFFGSPCQRPSEKDSVRRACFAHRLRIGTEMSFWFWELPFGANHPAASFPFLLPP